MSESWSGKKERIEAYYESLIEKHGTVPRACDYGRPESQEKKFKVLSDVMDLNDASVLDVGCGFADFYTFLKKRYPNSTYTGVDITQGMVDGALKAYPGVRVQKLDILDSNPGKFDLVTANGIFYLIGEQADEMMKKLVARMYELCNKAVAFNSLSTWCSDKEDNEFYADPLKTLQFCKTLTPWVTLRHDYHTRDFTIYMYREQTEL